MIAAITAIDAPKFNNDEPIVPAIPLSTELAFEATDENFVVKLLALLTPISNSFQLIVPACKFLLKDNTSELTFPILLAASSSLMSFNPYPSLLKSYTDFKLFANVLFAFFWSITFLKRPPKLNPASLS